MISLIGPETIWSTKVGEWGASIDRHEGRERPFSFWVHGKMEGMGGPAQSFEEAKARISDFLARKGLKLPRPQNRIPGLP